MNLIPIVYENNEILIVNKPAGLPVQGGENAAHPLDEELGKQLGYKIYLVHRLDRDTAGLLVVAKNSLAASKWIRLIGSGRIRKEYNAICVGSPDHGREGVISDNIEQRGVEKYAVTHFEVLTSAVIPSVCTLTLLRLTLETGRMHQIRIHLAKMGCPIAGDDRHGDFKINRLLRKNAGIKQLLLASVRLTLPPECGNSVFEVPLPDHMKRVVDMYFA